MAADGKGTDAGADFELRIERLVAGGEGLGFHEGRAVFVPLAAPGDLACARPVPGAKAGASFLKAELVETLEPGPGRAAPACPLFGTCGGCDLMHLSREVELEAKRGILAESFARIGKLEAPGIEIHAGAALGYRNRMRLRRSADGRAALTRRRGSDAVPLETCPIASPELRAWIEERARLRDMRADLEFGADETGGAPDSVPGAPPGAGRGRGRGGSGAAAGAAAGTTVFGSGGRVWVGGVDAEAEASVAGRTFRFDPAGFFQSNLELFSRLAPLATRALAEAAPARGRAVELYGGVGVLGAFLADAFDSVVSVEGDPRAAPFASSNLGPRGVARRASAEDWVRSAEARAPFDAVLVDPPRAGLSPAVRAWLAASGARALSYVSCDPATLARDSGELSRAGWRLERLALFDFYPGTRHLESWALLVKDRSS
ncbi:MAG: class I SAM-dependent RNA methyltransferase [Spirochaetia bacterium]|nr:class I SAM-dependent RNA methyltransferase [Spirochaetia bacterium]